MLSMNRLKFLVLTLLLAVPWFSWSQDFVDVSIDSEITRVQPMTGIVFWPTNSQIETDIIALEYSYMLYEDVVIGQDTYDWNPVEELLNEMSSRGHQAILRFRFSYPGYTTSVPQYIKDLPDYNETMGLSEGHETWFPDWTHPELQRFTLAFYEEYAKRYDNDPRLAFVQTGFGLWAEYHIYDGPFVLGETFPSKEFQAGFLQHLDTVFQKTHWSISIDAASSTYSPFSENEELLDLRFGLFDDSFMHAGHAGYNTNSWNFFDRERYQTNPAGGEFSYYTTYDQQNVLNEHIGAHGIPFEEFVEDFHMSYINGNDQSRYQSMERIKEASMYMGYRYKIVSFKTANDTSVVTVKNVGVAPIYYDAYLAVNDIRSATGLIGLQPDEQMEVGISAGGDGATLTIESDRLLPGQVIEYYGTENDPYVYVRPEVTGVKKKVSGNSISINSHTDRYELRSPTANGFTELAVVDLNGRIIHRVSQDLSTQQLEIDKAVFSSYPSGLYIFKTNIGTAKVFVD